VCLCAFAGNKIFIAFDSDEKNNSNSRQLEKIELKIALRISVQKGTAYFPSCTLSPIPESFCIDKTLECSSPGTQSCFLGGVEMQHEWMDTVLKSKRGRNAENETYKTIEETFGQIVTKIRKNTVRSSSHQKSNGPDSKNNNKMVSMLNSFRSSNGIELSMSQILKCATLTDTKTNRILIKALVADGRLLVAGRSRATRYRLANHDRASAPIGGNDYGISANIY
jgi:hypothetical protein